MTLGTTYFYTATILNWTPLLYNDEFKKIILNSLEFLVLKNKLIVYGFVIMPNHIHIIWQNIKLNGKETPCESFMKFTAHEFQTQLRLSNDNLHNNFLVKKSDRNTQFWQRGALPIEILSREMLEQKLNYIHLNPLQQHWNLVTDPNDYVFSSCSFYGRNDHRYSWLRDYREDF